jgi:hypothetical protein
VTQGMRIVTSIFAKFISPSWEKAILNLAVKRGIEEGKDGLPTRDTPKYSVGETDVRNAVEKQVIDIHTRLDSEVQRIVPRITSDAAAVHQCEVEFEARLQPSDLEDNLKAEFEAKRAALVDASLRRHRSEGHYNAFRMKHGVRIDPDHPKDRLNYLSAIFLVLVIETLINAGFWAEANDGYVTGALGTALAIAGGNIAVGFLGGIAFSYTNLKDTSPKFVGWLGALAAAVGVLVLNWEVLVIRNDHAAASSTSPTQIHTLMSIIVFLVGVGFALIAAWKGYRFFGSYPGYKDASDSFVKATQELRDVEGSLRDMVVKTTREQENVRSSTIRKIGEALTRYQKIRGDLNTLNLDMRNSIASANGVLERAVGAYRTNNNAVKGAAIPSPSWFNDPVERHSDESAVMNNTILQLDDSFGAAESISARLRQTTMEELPELTRVRNSLTGEQLTQLLVAADQEGLRRFLESLDSDVGNQGLRPR